MGAFTNGKSEVARIFFEKHVVDSVEDVGRALGYLHSAQTPEEISKDTSLVINNTGFKADVAVYGTPTAEVFEAFDYVLPETAAEPLLRLAISALKHHKGQLYDMRELWHPDFMPAPEDFTWKVKGTKAEFRSVKKAAKQAKNAFTVKDQKVLDKIIDGGLTEPTE